MELFRISLKEYSKILSGSGAASRWNHEGECVIYAGSSRSLSTLELVVHRNSIEELSAYEMMVISVADDEDLIEQIRIENLPDNWRSFRAYSMLQELGSAWYRRQRTLFLRVPSAVIPQEYNYILNTRHPLFSKNVTLVRNEEYFFDERLFG